MKRIYQKPSMKVYEVNMSQIICQSGGEQRNAPKRHGDEMGYIPGLTDEEHLA